VRAAAVLATLSWLAAMIEADAAAPTRAEDGSV
jgi:hypothetical protein